MNNLSEILQSYDYLGNGVIVYDVASGGASIKYANPAALELLGYEDTEELKRATDDNFINLINKEDADKIMSLMMRAQENYLSRVHKLQYRMNTADGKTVVIEDIGKVVRFPELGELVLCTITKTDGDITYIHEISDELTGLMSMGQFLQFCTEMIRDSSDEDSKEYKLVYFNIKNFKGYNVENGTQPGNKVLVTLARIIQYYSTTKINARFGNDHFVCVTKSSEMYERVRSVIADFNLRYYSKGISLKAGFYRIKDKNEDIAIACDLAKSACDSIRNSKEDIREYDDTLQKKLSINNYVISHIDEAIANSYIKVYYQPVIRTINGALCGMEALARWIDPVAGFLSPADFIPPLEDNLLITKLDLFMIREVCREMKEASDKGLILVPVSFNLSRIDFINCDIYAEVDKIVKEYNVPRDLINVEITESTVIDNPELIRTVIDDFRGHGYQVWMDDFGSGYSSLNVLQEYDFDEIKLDMEFMRKFNDKSKSIVRSIISMAKKLGVRTLAEGVETEEQFNFLKEIGCERVQGYYYSPPTTLPDMMNLVNENSIPVETRLWRQYYDKVGEIDFMTDRALAIVEFEHDTYKLIYANDVYDDVSRSLVGDGVDATLIYTNSFNSHLRNVLRDFQKTLKLGEKEKTFDYSINGQYVRLNVRIISQADNRAIDCVEMINLTSDELEQEKDALDDINRMIYTTYESVYAYDLNTHNARTILKSANYVFPDHNTLYAEGGPDYAWTADEYIHRDDRAAFLEFVDPATKMERIKNSGRSHIVGYFRTKTSNGAYRWMAHIEQYVPERNLLIYTTSYAPVLEYGLIDRLAPEYEALQNDDSHLWFALKDSRVLNIFWKDKDRRFVGANAKFLETYGIEDISELIGKTDEDMNWHIENIPFRNDELEVINNGRTMKNRLGKCIIKGALHNIIASKEPIYHDGEIVCLIGTFVNVDEIAEAMGNLDRVPMVDTLTGLLSAHGMVNAISDYLSNWKIHKDKFVVANISYGVYDRILRDYGDNTARKIFNELGKVYTEELKYLAKNHVVGARLYADSFTFLANYEDRSEIEELFAYLEKKSDEIHELAGVPITLNPRVEVHYCDDTSERELVAFATGGIPEESIGRADSDKAGDASAGGTKKCKRADGKSKILIVDDAEISREILRELLEDQYVIEEAANGEEALEKIKSEGDDLSAVIMDLRMPGMDGFQVCEALKEENIIDSLPVIILTADTALDSEIKCFELGCFDFMRKPFSQTLLAHRVNNAVIIHDKMLSV